MSPTNILSGSTLEGAEEGDVSAQNFDVAPATHPIALPSRTSRLFAYIDLHGHASKRGLFLETMILLTTTFNVLLLLRNFHLRKPL